MPATAPDRWTPLFKKAWAAKKPGLPMKRKHTQVKSTSSVAVVRSFFRMMRERCPERRAKAVAIHPQCRVRGLVCEGWVGRFYAFSSGTAADRRLAPDAPLGERGRSLATHKVAALIFLRGLHAGPLKLGYVWPQTWHLLNASHAFARAGVAA